MIDREELIKKANEWAEMTWDESEKSDKSTNDLCKACGSLGWSRGYEQGQKEAEVLVAKNIFAGFCVNSRDTKEKEILCRVIDKLYPAIRIK